MCIMFLCKVNLKWPDFSCDKGPHYQNGNSYNLIGIFEKNKDKNSQNILENFTLFFY